MKKRELSCVNKMNPFILALIIGMAFANFSAFLGILTAIVIIYFLDPKAVKYRLTHWGWGINE